jgi:hypothetical protein
MPGISKIGAAASDPGSLIGKIAIGKIAIGKIAIGKNSRRFVIRKPLRVGGMGQDLQA